MRESINPSNVMSHALNKYDLMVLLVDDQAMIAEAIRRALAGQPDIVFHYCDNPAEAIAVADRIKPMVILQDLIMPRVDGMSLVRDYRTNPVTKDVPIIVLSTKEDPVVKSDAFAAGANDYLVKLPDTIELIARIRYHSRAYLNLLQRDQAYQALRQSQRQLLETNLELQRLTSVDGLTGLSNRRYLDEYMNMQWKLALREQVPLSALMIDVDDFKRYNDTYGHLAGDEVLKCVAVAIQKGFVRPADLAARFGGEEFLVILPTTPLAPAQSLAEKLRRNVEDLRIPHSASTVAKHVTISVGGTTAIPQCVDSYRPLIEAADAALYEAKKAGKNRVIAHEQSFSAEADTSR